MRLKQILAIAVLSIACVAVLISLRTDRVVESPASTSHQPVENQSATVKAQRGTAKTAEEFTAVANQSPEESVSTTAGLAAASPQETTATEVAEEPEPTHYHNGLDPNQQPRDVVHVSFAGHTLPADYHATGDIRVSPAGITLPPPTSAEPNKPRIAMIESPTLPLNFASNAVNPLWKETSPDGTEVLVEVALSPDGQHWTDWMPTTSAHYEGDMSPTFPDGRPNPNYGYTLGDMTFYGLKQFRYFRYSMTLYSESDASPVVSDFRLFYQDSTLGDGQIAQPESDTNNTQSAQAVQ